MDDSCENNIKSSDRLKQEANDLAYCEGTFSYEVDKLYY